MQLKKVVNWRMMKQKYSTLKRCTERINWIISQRFLQLREEDIDYKKLSEDIFLAVLIF